MHGKSLYEFYEKFLLLQFGIQDQKIVWSHSHDIGPDEVAHYFEMDGYRYVLVFEDYGGLAVEEKYVQETLNLEDNSFQYISPISATKHAPSYIVKFSTPYQYCENVTGAFTLIKSGPA